MAFIDENGEYCGPSAASPAAAQQALRRYRETLNRSIEPTVASPHKTYINMRTDEILYKYGILQRHECNRDADLSNLPDCDLITRDMLSFAGQRAPVNSNDLYRTGMSSSDLPLLLENIGRKALTLGYQNSGESWQHWTRTTVTKDFKEFTRPLAVTLPTPPEVKENQPAPFANLLGDSAERTQVKEYAEIISISRQALASDDLQALTVDAAAAGRAIARLIGDLAIGVLVDNSVLSDSVALFHNGTHGNDATTGAAPSVTSLDEMRSLMAVQSGPGGEALNLRPRFIIGPPDQESTLAVIRGAQSDDPTGMSTGVISTMTDSRLAGSNAWYGICDPLLTSGIEVVVLEGTEGRPRFERTQPRNTSIDGVHFKIGYDVTVIATDYKTLARNAGA